MGLCGREGLRWGVDAVVRCGMVCVWWVGGCGESAHLLTVGLCGWLGLSVGQFGGMLFLGGSNSNAMLTNVTITNVNATATSRYGGVVRLHAVWL